MKSRFSVSWRNWLISLIFLKKESLERHRVNCLIMDACHDEGYEEGKMDGIQQGIKQEFLRISKELKANGVSAEIIMKIMHLSADEIQKL